MALEPLGGPEVYGNDRLFVYLRNNGELDAGITALRDAGFPVIELPITNPYDAGAEFYRWEIAISVACHILGINPFDQPDVQDSKLRTLAAIADYQKMGRLDEGEPIFEKDGLRLYSNMRLTGTGLENDLGAFLASASAGDYVAINAYLPRNGEMMDVIQKLRIAIRAKTKCAVTAGFGPRFQHSTGQFHKGGPNKGNFIQVVYDTENDMEIPTQGLTFGTLIRAQALGDYEALKAAGRKAIRIKLNKLEDLTNLL